MSTNVCNSQDQFNQAFVDALKYTRKQSEPKMWVQLVVLGLVVVMMVWALMLARGASGDRILHYLFALLASPLYIISYYLDSMKN